MATVIETKIKGRAYRIFDEVNNIWKRISYWTAASDVEFEDGQNLEDKLEGDFIQKEQLTFTLDGSDLYITKNY